MDGAVAGPSSVAVDGNIRYSAVATNELAVPIGDESKLPSQLFACSACHFTSTTESALATHKRHLHTNNPFERSTLTGTCQLLPNGRASCDVCGQEVWPRYMEAHMRRHYDVFECSQCQAKFRSKKDLSAHAELHTNTQVVCPECGVGFPSRAVFRVHRSRMHNNHNRSSNPAKQLVKCDTCDLMLQKCNLKQHRKTHNTDRETVLCTECGIWLSSDIRLREHQDNMHKTPQPVRCSKCGLMCRNKNALRYHSAKKCSNRVIMDEKSDVS